MENSYMEKLANIVSFIFHPLFMPSLGILLLFNSGTHLSLLPYEFKVLVFFAVFIPTCIIPIALLPFLKLRGIIHDFRMRNIKERTIPLLLTFISYGTGFVLINEIALIPVYIKTFVFAASCSILLAFLITLRWKISIHMLGIGGVTGSLLSLINVGTIQLQVYLLVLFIGAGFLGIARLVLHAHNQAQIYAGYAVGVGTVLLILQYMRV